MLFSGWEPESRFPAIISPRATSFGVLALSELLQGALDDFVLHTLMKLCEEGTEAGNTDHQITVFLRIFLSCQQGFT